MSTDSNKAVVRRWIEDGWNKHNLGLIDELYAADVVQYDPAGATARGRAEVKRYIEGFRVVLPDLTFTIESLVAEGDRVVWRFTSRGTQKGPLMNIPPSGKSAVVVGMVEFRLAGGKIAEVWVNFDALGLLRQIGVIPEAA